MLFCSHHHVHPSWHPLAIQCFLVFHLWTIFPMVIFTSADKVLEQQIMLQHLLLNFTAVPHKIAVISSGYSNFEIHHCFWPVGRWVDSTFSRIGTCVLFNIMCFDLNLLWWVQEQVTRDRLFLHYLSHYLGGLSGNIQEYWKNGI